MLAVAQQIAQQRQLGLIRRAHQSGIVAVERDIFDGAILRGVLQRVHCCHRVGAGNRQTLRALDAEPRNDNSHPSKAS